jgi:predicted outer membrane protein
MWTSIRRAAGTLAVAALCTATALAQQQPRPPAAKGSNAPGQPAVQPGGRPLSPIQHQQLNDRPQQRTANKPVNQSPAQVDQMIAGMLALCNEEEAAVGKFAAGHAQNEEVQKFANTMAKDHAMMAKQLQKWAPEATLMNREERTSDNAQAHTTGAAMQFDPLHVHQQIASRCIASTEKSLGSKKGADFDMAYIGSQCVTHQQMIDKASVLREYASPELKSAIDNGIESAESHLQHVHQLMEKLVSSEKSSK